MANYCCECKFATQKSSGSVYCSKHQDWMDQYASCNDYKWVKSRFRAIHILLLALLTKFVL